MQRPLALAALALCSALAACGSDDPSGGTSAVDAGAQGAVDFASRFTNLQSHTTVDCTLSDGTATTCHKLVFTGTNPTDDGPYCPEKMDDIGGVGVYDGKTNPGFQLLTRKLWESMEADGYDIVDDEGKVRVLTDLKSKPESGKGYCLALEKVPLTLTYLIPTTPKKLGTPATIGTVEKIGVQLDGIPMTGDPPSVVSGPPGMAGAAGGAIPSIDPCGGHPDPAGYYHAHFVPESMNLVLKAHGITAVSCTRVKQADHVLAGFAKDGYPVYSASASDQPTDLDACNGKTGPTAEFPDGTYHYYAFKDQAPNMPPCLVGASVDNVMSYQ